MKPPLWKYFAAADADQLALTLQQWHSDMPDLGVLAFVSEHDTADVPLLQQIANQRALPLAGTIVPGLIVGGELKKQGLLLAAHAAANPQAMIPLQQQAMDDGTVAELAAFVELHASEDGEDTLLLFIDAMTPHTATLLDKLYLNIGNRVHYAGAHVGSETFQPMRCLFDNTSFVKNAVLAMLLPKHAGAALAHRYCQPAPLGVASSASANRIALIDGRPAFEAYRRLVSDVHGVELTRENFYQYAVHFPLALHLAEGEPLVRIAVAIDESGCLSCVGEIPEASLLSVVQAAHPDSSETVREIAAEISMHTPQAALVFYCAGRLMHHGMAAAGKELAEMQNALFPAPVFGALSLGEIANYKGAGYPRFHNATLVALPWT
jgi:hypothetical protein